MAVRVAFMPGAAEGYRFFLTPDFKEAFSSDTLFQAAGQAFFSLSVGMGCMITYASYFNEKTNLIGTSLSVSLLTLFVATLPVCVLLESGRAMTILLPLVLAYIVPAILYFNSRWSL